MRLPDHAFSLNLLLAGLSTVQGLCQSARTLQPVPQLPFAVAVSEGGGLDEATLRTLRSLIQAELRRAGQPVGDDASFAISPDAQAVRTAAKDRRILVLRVAGRLGAKVPLILEEVDAESRLLGSATLTAANLEECDIVIPRLVQALLGHKPVEQTARTSTLTESESREFRTKPGRSHFILGLAAAAFKGSGSEDDKSGLSLGWLYTTERWNLGAELGSVGSGNAGIGYPILIHAAYLPMDGPTSPYIGAGVGYFHVEEQGYGLGNALGVRLSAGVEFFRLHRMRLQVGLDVYLPSNGGEEQNLCIWDPFSGQGTMRRDRVESKSAYAAFHVKVAF